MKPRFLDPKLEAATRDFTLDELQSFRDELARMAETISIAGVVQMSPHLSPKIKIALCLLVSSEIADTSTPLPKGELPGHPSSHFGRN